MKKGFRPPSELAPGKVIDIFCDTRGHKDAIKAHIDNFHQETAQAIRNSDWFTVGRNVAFVLAVLPVAVILSGVVLVLVVKLLGTLLGKVLAVSVVLFIIGMSYKMNFEDARAARRKKANLLLGTNGPRIFTSMFVMLYFLCSGLCQSIQTL